MNKDQSGVERDAEGRIAAVKLDRHILDPESPEAVQVPLGSGAGVDAVEDAFGGVGEDFQAPIDDNLKIGDQTADILDNASRTHGVGAGGLARRASGDLGAGGAVDGVEAQLREAEASRDAAAASAAEAEASADGSEGDASDSERE